jgi:hypothetical protein
MHIAVIILRNEELTQTVVSRLIECGIFDATVLDGEGIEHYATETIPMFSSLKALFGERSTYTTTIIAAVESSELLLEFVELCRKAGVDFHDEAVGTVMAFPCDIHIGGR